MVTEQSAVEHPIHLPESSLWHKLPLITLIVGVVALGLAAAMAWGTKQFFFSYLVAFCYFLSLAIGGLFFVIVQFATRAGWSVVVRRVAEHLMSTLPLFVPLFIPIAIGLHELYHWTHAEAVSTDPLLTAKSPYLNERGFYFRAAAYFAVWVTLARLFHARSIKQDSSGDVGLTKKMQVLSGPAIALFAFTVTFAAFDWIMSLDPHWYSTMFGPYFFAGAVVSEFALLAVLHILLQRAGGFGQVNAEHYHDLGKLLFGFTVFWAYIAFSQFMLIWYSNIPEETLWYAHRGGPWLGDQHLPGDWPLRGSLFLPIASRDQAVYPDTVSGRQLGIDDALRRSTLADHAGPASPRPTSDSGRCTYLRRYRWPLLRCLQLATDASRANS